jgi:hypothetical protein
MVEENVNEIPVETAAEITDVETPEVESPDVETPEVETPAEIEPEDEAAPPVPQTVPLGVFVGKKKEWQAKERLLLEQIQRQAAAPPVPPPPPIPEEKSPLELFAEQYGEETSPDTKTLIAQKRFENQQVEKRQQQGLYMSHLADVNAGISDARLNMTADEMGEGLGFDDLLNLGGNLLTPGDQLNIWNAKRDSGKESYKIVTQRILRSGGKQAQILRSRLDSRAKQLKENPQQDGSAENPTTTTPKPKSKVNPTQAQVLREFKDPLVNSIFGTPPASEEE